MDPTDTPTAIPWWQSRIIWAQLVAAVFALAAIVNMFTGYDVIGKLGLDQEKILAAIMLIVPAVTIMIRAVNPTPTVTGSKAAAARINSQPKQ